MKFKPSQVKRVSKTRPIGPRAASVVYHIPWRRRRGCAVWTHDRASPSAPDLCFSFAVFRLPS